MTQLALTSSDPHSTAHCRRSWCAVRSLVDGTAASALPPGSLSRKLPRASSSPAACLKLAFTKYTNIPYASQIKLYNNKPLLCGMPNMPLELVHNPGAMVLQSGALLLFLASASAQCGPSANQPYPPGTTTCPGSTSGGTTIISCAADGADYSWSDTVSTATRTIAMSGCPNHPTADLNPNYAIQGSLSYSIPAVPELRFSFNSQETSLAAVGSVVGVTFDGTQMCAANRAIQPVRVPMACERQ